MEGDYTQNSRDSRSFGPVPYALVQGRLLWRVCIYIKSMFNCIFFYVVFNYGYQMMCRFGHFKILDPLDHRPQLEKYGS